MPPLIRDPGRGGYRIVVFFALGIGSEESRVAVLAVAVLAVAVLAVAVLAVAVLAVALCIMVPLEGQPI